MGCHPWKGRRIVRCACRHGRMMQAWDLAMEVWQDRAEASSRGHATEYAEYKAAHPMPNVGDFMKGSY